MPCCTCSAQAPEQVEYGAEHYRPQSADTSTIVNQLFEKYQVEGLTMPYTMEDFRRDVAREHVHELTPEERLAGLPLEQILAALPPEKIEAYLKRLPPKRATTRKKKRKPPD